MADDPPTFVCDAMLGGLARWLRAAGYDAEFLPGVADADLVARGEGSGRMILSSDSGLFERKALKSKRVRALFVPRGLGTMGELAFVMKEMGLALREPRCMSCGGELTLLAKDEVESEAPPRTFEITDTFWRCARCARLLWRGTHWTRISARLERVVTHR